VQRLDVAPLARQQRGNLRRRKGGGGREGSESGRDGRGDTAAAGRTTWRAGSEAAERREGERDGGEEARRLGTASTAASTFSAAAAGDIDVAATVTVEQVPKVGRTIAPPTARCSASRSPSLRPSRIGSGSLFDL
jgi:hypothetical protein